MNNDIVNAFYLSFFFLSPGPGYTRVIKTHVRHSINNDSTTSVVTNGDTIDDVNDDDDNNDDEQHANILNSVHKT